jgi:hypothetical protein
MIIVAQDPSAPEVLMAAVAMKLPMWYRTLAVIVGVFSIALAMIVLIEPLLALWLLILFLALALLMMGIDRLVAGVTGHPFGTAIPLMPTFLGGGDAGKTASSPPGQPPQSKP